MDRECIGNASEAPRPQQTQPHLKEVGLLSCFIQVTGSHSDSNNYF